VIDEAGAQGESPADGGVGQVYATAFDHLPEDCGVDLVTAAVSEAHGAQLHRREELQARSVVDGVSQLPRMIEIGPDGGPKCIETVIAQGQPDLQGTKPPRQLGRFLEERKTLVRLAHGYSGLRFENPGIFSGMRKGGACARGFLEKAHSAINRLIQPLVEIQRERVRRAQTPEFLRSDEGCRRTVGPVDVQPDSLRATQGGDSFQWVDRSRTDGPGRSNDRERCSTCRPICRNRALQRAHFHPKVLVNRDQAKVAAAQSEEGHGLCHRHMCFARGVNHAGSGTVLVGGQTCFPCHRQGHEVGRRPSATETPGHPAATQRFGNPANHLALDRDRGRCGAPGRDVLIQYARQEIREGRDRLA